MTDRESRGGGELQIRISPEGGLQAIDLAKLLTSLSKDYSAVTGGRSLVLSDVAHGSIVLLFLDAAMSYGHKALEAIEGINALADFSAKLKKGMDYFRLSKEPHDPQPNADASLKEMFNIAVKAKAHVEVKRRASDGSEIVLSVSPGEAEALKRVKKRRQKQLPAMSPEALPKRTVLGLAAFDDMPPAKVAETIMAISSLEARGSNKTLKEVIKLVKEHCQLQPLKLKSIASELRSRGRRDLAEMLLPETPPGTFLTAQ